MHKFFALIFLFAFFENFQLISTTPQSNLVGKLTELISSFPTKDQYVKVKIQVFFE